MIRGGALCAMDQDKYKRTQMATRRMLAGLGALDPLDYLTYEELVYVLQMPFHRVRRLLAPLINSGLVAVDRLHSDRRRVGMRLTPLGRGKFSRRVLHNAF